MFSTRSFLSSTLVTYLLLSALVNGDEVEHQCAQFGANKVEGAHLNEIPIDLAFIIPHNDAFVFKTDVQCNELSTLTKSVMRRFKHLKKLRIQNGLIKRIEDDAFQGFHNLEELNLKENEIYRLGLRMNAHLPQLHTLILSNNRLKDDSFEIIAKMGNLKTLDVSNNLIENAKFSDGSILTKLEEDNMRSVEFSNSGNLADIFKLIAFKPSQDAFNTKQVIFSESWTGKFKAVAIDFDGYTPVRSIDMSHNEISHVDRYDFIGLGDLKFLSQPNRKHTSWHLCPFEKTNRVGS
ncbi:hypothetical protein ACOME3_003698 [Neoechinorhynchus agilis]